MTKIGAIISGTGSAAIYFQKTRIMAAQSLLVHMKCYCPISEDGIMAVQLLCATIY
jgi:hypothetical protein